MNKVVFLTFADSKYKKSLLRLQSQVNQSKCITDTYFFTEKDLESNFAHKFRPWLYRRGYGYWQWKSYLIEKVMVTLTDGDVMIWSDVGNVYNVQAEKRLEEYIDRVCKSVSGLLVFSQKQIEKAWTKADCLEYFGVLKNELITDTPQYWAGGFLICKNKFSMTIIHKWADVAINHFDLITDKRSVLPNLSGFIEHRHDQSVFSILAKLYHADAYPPNEVDKSNFENIPIQPRRFKQKDVFVNIGNKLFLPIRYAIGIYLKYVKHFDFHDRIIW